jgi:hypothetical protein
VSLDQSSLQANPGRKNVIVEIVIRMMQRRIAIPAALT